VDQELQHPRSDRKEVLAWLPRKTAPISIGDDERGPSLGTADGRNNSNLPIDLGASGSSGHGQTHHLSDDCPGHPPSSPRWRTGTGAFELTGLDMGLRQRVTGLSRCRQRPSNAELSRKHPGRGVARMQFSGFLWSGRPATTGEGARGGSAQSAGCVSPSCTTVGRYACRHCHDLTFKSTRDRTARSTFRGPTRFVTRLGWGGGVASPMGDRPKGMHLTTYLRLLNELSRHGIAALPSTEKLVSQMMRKLDSIRLRARL
jgi:hypothetical protein